jgi:ABC-type dipeptide/oligopeptide/nickel transport system permease component
LLQCFDQVSMNRHGSTFLIAREWLLTSVALVFAGLAQVSSVTKRKLIRYVQESYISLSIIERV